ncbi:hypothetical protein LLG95_04325 [bacterium]|nr:hypothetical protein [bacterium]
MKFKFKRPVFVVCVILFIVGFVSLSCMIPITAEQRALRLYRSKLQNEAASSYSFRSILFGRYEYYIEPIGAHSWFVYRVVRDFAPELAQDRYVVLNGKASPVSAEALDEVFKTDVREAQTDAEQMKVCRRYLELLEPHPFALKIISGTSDIQDYAKAPLKPELAATIKPHQVEVKPDGARVHIFYTHNDLSGSVRRQEFTFNRSGHLIDVRYTEIGTGIGGTHGLV